MGLGKFLGFEKLSKFLEIIKFNGGLKNSILTILRTDDLKIGTLVGVDQFGNKYYQNNYYFFATNRWVIYSNRFGYDYDASQIPVEWFGWLHYKTDLIPGKDFCPTKYKWMIEHEENLSGTPKEYVPYSTCTRKIEPWVPPKACK